MDSNPLEKEQLDISGLPVNTTHCKTCPFVMNPELANTVIERNLNNQSSQVCHGTEKSDRTPTSLCRGMRDIQLKIFTAMGFLSEPTDEAWNQKLKEIKEAS